MVKFTPDSTSDFEHDLLCTTDREKFLVPIRTIGARGIVCVSTRHLTVRKGVIDIADEITVTEKGPVKCTTSKTILVQNVGDKVANFSLHANTPFKAVPSEGSLNIGQRMQIEIFFSPKVHLLPEFATQPSNDDVTVLSLVVLSLLSSLSFFRLQDLLKEILE